LHVEVDITILYYNWSKNRIGTKLRKQSKRTGMGTGWTSTIGLKLDMWDRYGEF